MDIDTRQDMYFTLERTGELHPVPPGRFHRILELCDLPLPEEYCSSMGYIQMCIRDRYKRSRSQGFGPEVKRRIMLGSFVLSSGYYDAYYLKALRVKALDRKSTRLNSSHEIPSRMPSSA